jgi:serine/threonine protein phosphatase PrpC
VQSGGELHVQIGLASERGERARNEDYLAVYTGTATERTSHGLVAAIADGVGGAKGGREAAELSVRSFIEGYLGQPATLNVERAAARALEAANRWIFAQGQRDPNLLGMATTLSALVLIGHKAHAFHVGDSRVYRFSRGQLRRLTEDHVHRHPDLSHVLYRAIGMEETLRLDHVALVMETFDRFLLCTDGVHASLSDARIAEHLGRGAAADETARSLVAAALSAGSQDNASALVLDVIALPPRDWAGVESEVGDLAIGELPKPGDEFDGFRVGPVLSDGRYCRLYRASDLISGREVVLKIPRPRGVADTVFRAAFVREALVASQMRSPWIGEIVPLPAERRTRLYLAMPFYDGENMECRLARQPRLSLTEGVKIGIDLAKAVAALHRAGIVHRDLKPENVMLLKGGGLKLLDFGVARLAKIEDPGLEIVPGTPSFMAPEMREGSTGDELTDLYALGVTLYRLFSGHYPYGEIEPFSHPRLKPPTALSRYRPDLPAWLDFSLSRAFAIDRGQRHGDVLEFAFEIENGLARGGAAAEQRRPLYERNPLLFWQVMCMLLLGLLALSWAVR